MAKRIVQILSGISCLLLMAVVYFILANDNRMVVLSTKLMVATFLVFLITSLIFRALETEGKAWYLLAIIGGFVLAYFLYLGVCEIGTQVVHRDQIAGLGGLGFLKNVVIAGLIMACLTAVFCGLIKTKGGHHG